MSASCWLLVLCLMVGGAGWPPAAAAGKAQVYADVRIEAGAANGGCGAHVVVRLANADGPLVHATVGIEWRNGVTTLARATRVTSEAGEIFAWLPNDGGGRPKLALTLGGAALEQWAFARPDGEACPRGTVAEWLSRKLEATALAPRAEPLGATRLDPFPIDGQDRNLSCEFASVQIATTYFGRTVTEYDVEGVVGYDPNPHKGYRGNIEGLWGNTTDYGVYNDALGPAMPAFGYAGDAFYARGDANELKFRLDAGIPVIVWLAQQGDRREVVEIEGRSVTLLAGVHVMVAFAYDETGVTVSDPAEAIYIHYDWEGFMWAWSLLDGMALSVTPLA